jgi:hypothetical protein
MDEKVSKGTQCARGVNERCWAAQLVPFTNNSCWYLDQALMGTMASKIRSLVPYYVNPDTVSEGTTNISMLTVTGVWEKLKIGDYTNKFTQTPASGTNAAVLRSAHHKFALHLVAAVRPP